MSLRSILTYVAAIVVSAFVWVLFVAPATFAADASWLDGDTIRYQTKEFDERTASANPPSGLRSGQTYYQSDPYNQDIFSGESDVAIIYFQTSSIATQTSAKYSVYRASGDGSRLQRSAGPNDISITPRAQSASSSQAAWNGDDIEYDSRTYTGPQTADGSRPQGIPSGRIYYSVIGTPDALGNARGYALYFADGADPTTATRVTFQEYEVNGSGQVGSPVGSSRSVDLTPKAESPGNSSAADATATTSCAIEGIGWIVCPFSQFLADGMDWVYEQLKTYMEYRILSNDTNSGIYRAWSVGLAIANLAFMIAFLVIIYSYLTNSGISNYGLKKLFPRLIVAAILVNISYWICALAVDLSNVMGAGLQNVLVSIRDQLVSANTSYEAANWKNITTFILGGGTAAVATTVGLSSLVIGSGGSVGAAALLLLPALLALVIAVLIAFAILAARQALITLLIIVSPLAFVAYLLPNTEEWFTRWRKTFMTMLVFYPMFALIFGGSQLAGFLIRDNTDDFGVVLLSLFVQVAPLVLTPILIKLSGSIIGRIAGMVNNPSKGLIDRTRNWAKDQSQYLAKRNMARTDPVRRRQVFRQYALGMNQMKRAKEERTKLYDEMSDARWTNSGTYSDIQQRLRLAQDQKAVGTQQADLRYETAKTVTGEAQNVDVVLRNLKVDAENAKARADIQYDSSHAAAIVERRTQARVLKDRMTAIHAEHDSEYEEFKAGMYGHGMPRSAAMIAMQADVNDSTRRIALEAMRKANATRVIDDRFTEDMIANVRLGGQYNSQLIQTYAGGIHALGAQRSLAQAISTQAEATASSIRNANAILEHGNYTDDVITSIALNQTAGTGITITQDMRRAAVKRIAGSKNTTEILRLIEQFEIDGSDDNQDLRQDLHEEIMNRGARAKAMSAGFMGQFKDGHAPATGKVRLDTIYTNTLNSRKFGAEVLVTEDQVYLEQLLDTLTSNTSGIAESSDALHALLDEVNLAFSDSRFSGRIAERHSALSGIQAHLRSRLGRP